jgi:DNA-binding HxlR family transcriptional regulator
LQIASEASILIPKKKVKRHSRVAQLLETCSELAGRSLYMKHKRQRRSECPINFALETFGDAWSLLIIRDMVYFGKKTYGELLASDEGIATNILASRLAQLEQQGIIEKRPYEADKRKDAYVLTEKGLDLIPLLLELASWGARHDPRTGAPQEWIALVNADRANVQRLIRETVQRGGAIFTGPDSVVTSHLINGQPGPLVLRDR